MKIQLTAVLGVFFALIGSIKVGGGAMLPFVYNSQTESLSTRYQPALSNLLPRPNLNVMLEELPTSTLMFWIGVPELLFGIVMLLSLRIPGLSTASDLFTRIMFIHMTFPLTAHFLGDDFSLPLNSSVGPMGFVPAAVVMGLLLLRALFSASNSLIKLKSKLK